MLTILVIKGSFLDGAGKGVNFYVAKFEGSKLLEPELWKDAVILHFLKILILTLIYLSIINNH